MSIRDFIQRKVLEPRLKSAEVLVVYDPAGRYRDLCVEMSRDKCLVVDTSESSIESRDLAVETLPGIAERSSDALGMIVYVPKAAPVTDEEKQRDPFAVYGSCGGVFPAGDGDEYENLCLRAKPDHATEIRRVFASDPNPPFELIDAIGGGGGWPTLQTCLGVDSAREILLAFLAPSDQQLEKLKGATGWVAEARALFLQTVGLALKTKSNNWSPIAQDLWRFLLFSEFVFDLPGDLPEALADVPCAPPEAGPIVNDVCDSLREVERTRSLYVARAQAVEVDLVLKESCREIQNLGVRDTFPFEERSLLSRSVGALNAEDLDTVRQIVGDRARSVWTNLGENQAQWQVVHAALELVQACQDVAVQLPDHTRNQKGLIHFYAARLREVDRLQREFEQAEHDLIEGREAVEGLIPHTRAVYRSLMDDVQAAFIRHLESSGWPPSGILANSNAFDKLVAPRLRESGRKTAVFLIDSLRYELAVELEKLLAQDSQVEIVPTCAQLPTITPVGMASLLPNAGAELSLSCSEEGLSVLFSGEKLTQVANRMDVLRRQYGDRFTETLLSDFVRGRTEVPGSVELLVLRSTTIDQHLEVASEMALKSIHDSLKAISAALHRLETLGFDHAVVLTDHGFVLNPTVEAGDVCGKPPGNWLSIHDRLLLGDGSPDSANFVLSADHLGIHGDFNQVAGPRALVPYRSGVWYFHGGASLQEAIVPAMTIRIQAHAPSAGKTPSVDLSYRGETTMITTRLPVLQIRTGDGDLFFVGESFPVLLEAHDKKSNVVGEAKPGGRVNPATRTIDLQPNDVIQITLRMDEEFEGAFTVKVLDPKTQTIYSKLSLKTDYTV